MSKLGIIVGAATGLAVTTIVTLVWPKKVLPWLRPPVAALVGVGVAYVVMLLV